MAQLDPGAYGSSLARTLVELHSGSVRVDMECKVVRETRSLVFMDGSMSTSDEIVATARGIWKVVRSES